MFEQEMERAAEGALTETLGNLFYLINNWADVDMKRQDGLLTPDEQITQFSDVVRIMGVGLYDAMMDNPVMLVEVLTATEVTAQKMDKILSQKKEKN